MSTVAPQVGLLARIRVRMSKRRMALLFMLAFALGWAVVEDVFGANLQRAYDLTQIVWMRYGVHLLFVFAIWGWRNPSKVWRTRRPAYHLLRSMMMLIMPLSFAWAIKEGVPASTTWAIFWVAPLLVILIARRWWHEQPTSFSWIAVAIGTIGAVGVIFPNLPLPHTVPFAPIVMALSFAVYVGMTRSLRTERLETNLFYTAAGVFAALAVFMPRVWVTPSLHDMAMFFCIGAFGFVSLLLLDRAVARGPVSDSAPALYSQVAFAAAIVVLVGGQRPSLHVLAGVTLIAVAIVLAWLRASRSDTKDALA